jgi:hypothetical protein
MMNKDAGIIGVEKVKEHEDGSATLTFHFDAHAQELLAEEGLKLVLYCAAAKLDMGVVYDFIEDHIRYNKDEEQDKKFDEYGNYGENNPPVSSKGTWDSQDKTEDLT